MNPYYELCINNYNNPHEPISLNQQFMPDTSSYDVDE